MLEIEDDYASAGIAGGQLVVSGVAGQLVVSGVAGQLVMAGGTDTSTHLEALSQWSGLPVASLRSLAPEDLSAMWTKFSVANERTPKTCSAEVLAKACHEACQRLLLRDGNPATTVAGTVWMLSQRLAQLRGAEHIGYDSCAINRLCCVFVQSHVMLFVCAIA
jgi:hypothetical protein